jgi:hypothetical protein
LAPLQIPSAILWILIYFNLIHTTTELQTADYMYDEQPTLFPFNSDQESKTISMTQTTSSTEKTKLASLSTALGRSPKIKVRKVVVEGEPRGASKAAEGANKRDGETISTSSESRAHVDRKARVDTRANVVSPQGKEKTPTDKDESMEESEREAEAGMTVSLEDEAGNVKETETTPSEKETDRMEVNAAEADNEEDSNMMTADEEIEVEDNTKANANKEGKRSIEELNKGLKSNIVYEWPERTKFTRTQLARKITPVVWRKARAFTTLEPDKASTAGKSLMVAVAEYGDAWKENFQGEELNDKTVTKEKVRELMTALASDSRKDRKQMDLVKLATGFTKTSARFWLGVCESFGSTFELKEPIDIMSIIRQRKEEQKAQATKTLKFHPDTKGIGGEIHTSGAGMFLSQAGHRSKRPSEPVELPKKLRRKHQSFMKLVLPSNAPGVEKSEEACSNF